MPVGLFDVATTVIGYKGVGRQFRLGGHLLEIDELKKMSNDCWVAIFCLPYHMTSISCDTNGRSHNCFSQVFFFFQECLGTIRVISLINAFIC